MSHGRHVDPLADIPTHVPEQAPVHPPWDEDDSVVDDDADR